MLDKFEMGKRYVFSKEQHKKSCQLIGMDYSTILDWKYELDGREVTVYNPENGFIEGYVIDPHWCIEKEDI